jgi:asparagine synthase (glutamine-hydrolysing)
LLKTDLKNAIFESVRQSILNINTIGIAFSGGVDSALLASVCRNLEANAILLTVGFSNSHDIVYSKLISSKMNMVHLILEITYDDFLRTSCRIQKEISCKNRSHVENCIAFYYVAKLASTYGIKAILTANGFDELFCGYNSYRLIFNQGDSYINKVITDKIANEFELMNEINQTIQAFNIHVKQPFLSEKFISVAMEIPVSHKIQGSTDFLRKHILRKIALSLDVPGDSVIHRKKAFQYGTLIHKNYKDII